jgi:hypothetical protein
VTAAITVLRAADEDKANAYAVLERRGIRQSVDEWLASVMPDVVALARREANVIALAMVDGGHEDWWVGERGHVFRGLRLELAVVRRFLARSRAPHVFEHRFAQHVALLDALEGKDPGVHVVVWTKGEPACWRVDWAPGGVA